VPQRLDAAEIAVTVRGCAARSVQASPAFLAAASRSTERGYRKIPTLGALVWLAAHAAHAEPPAAPATAPEPPPAPQLTVTHEPPPRHLRMRPRIAAVPPPSRPQTV
jgi:hypothetical protein